MKERSKVIRRKPAGEEFNREENIEVKKDEDKPSKIDVANKLNGLVTIGDQIAQDKTVVFRQWMWPGGTRVYPNEVSMQWVDFYYPHAQGGPLLVDYPQLNFEIQRCGEKKKILKSLGLRYVFVSPKMKLNDALMQLEE